MALKCLSYIAEFQEALETDIDLLFDKKCRKAIKVKDKIVGSCISVLDDSIHTL
jgi:hypothetical protein